MKSLSLKVKPVELHFPLVLLIVSYRECVVELIILCCNERFPVPISCCAVYFEVGSFNFRV